jgi:hypothetical protein
MHQQHDDDAAGVRQDASARGRTWSGLLAGYTELAQAAVALPADAAGTRWKRAVPSLIALHAVAHAIAEIDSLGAGERDVALDKGEVLVRQHAAELGEIWRSEATPPGVLELMEEARGALTLATQSGVEWVVREGELVAPHPGELAADLEAEGFAGDVYLPAPGVALFAGCPCGFVKERRGGPPAKKIAAAVGAFLREAGIVAGPRPSPIMRQAYRQFDFAAGRAVRDLVLRMDAELEGGQPLLVAVLEGGKVQPVPLPPPPGYEQETLPVVEQAEQGEQ